MAEEKREEKKAVRVLEGTQEIEKLVALKIGNIGVGNAGNQAINMLYHSGITQNLFAINTSTDDLSDKVVAEAVPSFIIGKEGRGAGKDRDKAETLFKENGRDLFDTKAFNAIINDCDVIIVAYATGGGTGSMVGPRLLNILKNMTEGTRKVVIAYCFTPKMSDSPQAHANSINSLNDTIKAGVPVLCDDLATVENLSNNAAYKIVLSNYVEYVKTISGIYSVHTGNGMMDQNDMLTAISAPGYQAHYHVNRVAQEDLDEHSFQSIIINAIKKSTCMNIQKDGKLDSMGVIASYPASMSDVSKTGNYNELYEYLGNNPRACFENYGETRDSMASAHIILSGMTMPYDRILLSENVVKEHKRAQEKAQNQVDLDKVSAGISLDGSSKISGSKDIDATKANKALDGYFG